MDLRFVRFGFLVISALLGSQLLGMAWSWPLALRVAVGAGVTVIGVGAGVAVGSRKGTETTISSERDAPGNSTVGKLHPTVIVANKATEIKRKNLFVFTFFSFLCVV